MVEQDDAEEIDSKRTKVQNLLIEIIALRGFPVGFTRAELDSDCGVLAYSPTQVDCFGCYAESSVHGDDHPVGTKNIPLTALNTKALLYLSYGTTDKKDIDQMLEQIVEENGGA